MTKEAKPELTEAQIEEAAVADFNKDAGHSEPPTATGNEADQKQVTEKTPGEDPENPEHSQQGDEAGEQTGDDKTNQTDKKSTGGEKKKTRVQQILSDRNQARTEAAEGKQRENTKDTVIADLEAKVQDLTDKIDGKADGGDGKPKSTDTQNTVEKTTRKIIQEELSKVKAENASEKADAADVAKVIKSHPDAEELKDDITTAMEKHPTLSAIGAYHMIKSASTADGEAEGGEDGEDGSNAQQLKTGARSKGSLRQGKGGKKMSTDDMEEHLRNEQKSGNITL